MAGAPFPLDSEEKWQTLLGLIRTGKTFGSACRAVGMTRAAVGAYLQTRPLRAQEYLEAEAEATETIEEVLYESAVGGERWAVTMWLERRDKDRWAPQGADAGPARIILDPSALRELAAGEQVDEVQVGTGDEVPSVEHHAV